MSELLLFAIDQLPAINPNYAIRYRKGDIVAVFPDGHVWGALEGLPNFWQLSVVSIVSSDRVSFLEENRDIDGRVIIRRRRRFVDITQLSNFVQNNLANTGKSSVTRIGVLGALTLRP